MSRAPSPVDVHPDSIDTRLVLRIYAWIAIAVGLIVFNWHDWQLPDWHTVRDLPGIPWGRVGLYRTLGAALIALGFIAVGLSRIEHPVSRARGLHWFAVAHLTFGAVFFVQWYAIFDGVIPRVVAWTPLTVGVVLLFVSATFARAPRLPRMHRQLFEGQEGPMLVDRLLAVRGRSINALRSQYDEHIRQAARVEERARLARDLHDAVKQQLFAIQTSAATVEARLTSDRSGAQSAIGQVRQAARDAVTEMNALIEQLQTSPVENVGLVSALRQQCEALELRTGAHVVLDTRTLPPNTALPPGAQHALFRAAQEALSNVARHARATHVKVTLALNGDSLDLAVRDDGTGFDPISERSGMGVDNMKARICDVSGTFMLQTAPGKGTLVGFSVPCDVRTARDYAWKALSWAGVAAVFATSFAVGNHWERPWKIIFAVMAAITAARFAVAWRRVRGRAEAAA